MPRMNRPPASWSMAAATRARLARVAKRHREHQRPEADAPLHRRRVGVGDQRVQRIDRPRRPEEGEEVVGAPQRLEAQLLRPLDDVAPLVPADTLLALDHHAQLHAVLRLALYSFIRAAR